MLPTAMYYSSTARTCEVFFFSNRGYNRTFRCRKFELRLQPVKSHRTRDSDGLRRATTGATGYSVFRFHLPEIPARKETVLYNCTPHLYAVPLFVSVASVQSGFHRVCMMFHSRSYLEDKEATCPCTRKIGRSFLWSKLRG